VARLHDCVPTVVYAFLRDNPDVTYIDLKGKVGPLPRSNSAPHLNLA
jgi:hypothetical protein